MKISVLKGDKFRHNSGGHVAEVMSGPVCPLEHLESPQGECTRVVAVQHENGGIGIARVSELNNEAIYTKIKPFVPGYYRHKDVGDQHALVIWREMPGYNQDELELVTVTTSA